RGAKKPAPVKVFGAAFRQDFYVGAPRRAALGGIDGGADTKLRDGVESDIEPGVGFLRLFLDAAGVDAVKSKVAVVQGVAGEADGALGAVAVIDSAWRQQHQAGPVTSADRNLFNLLGFNQATHL